MSQLDLVLKNEERVLFNLRALYQRYGYAQYKMSKFEEYDLYVRNKDFLVSDHMITFTDTNGKLMALKPDVTLSIIKNTQDVSDAVEKVYYNENVYRVSRGDHTYREMRQAGLECIGGVDRYCINEVVSLAGRSLAEISDDYVLDISHLGVVSALMEELGLSAQAEQELVGFMGEKNLHSIAALCERESVDADKAQKLARLVSAYGRPEAVLSELIPLFEGTAKEALLELASVCKALKDEHIRIDFSLINDMNYYNGIVFRGFVNGIPSGVLSGGQYDRLMRRMGRRACAIGFAVYLDEVERLFDSGSAYDVDCILLYGEGDDIQKIQQLVSKYAGEGKSIMAQKSLPEKIRYRELLRLTERGVEVIENNA